MSTFTQVFEKFGSRRLDRASPWSDSDVEPSSAYRADKPVSALPDGDSVERSSDYYARHERRPDIGGVCLAICALIVLIAAIT